MPRPPGSTLFPYTTLFRSARELELEPQEQAVHDAVARRRQRARRRDLDAPERSEEHTSELQSHVNLVCRLLLEKKNQHEHTRVHQYRPPAQSFMPLDHRLA